MPVTRPQSGIIPILDEKTAEIIAAIQQCCAVTNAKLDAIQAALGGGGSPTAPTFTVVLQTPTNVSFNGATVSATLSGEIPAGYDTMHIQWTTTPTVDPWNLAGAVSPIALGTFTKTLTLNPPTTAPGSTVTVMAVAYNSSNPTLATASNRLTFVVPASGSGAPVGNNNGVWMQLRRPIAPGSSTFVDFDLTTTIMDELASHGIFNVYLECGWPTPAQAGIAADGRIPAAMQGLLPRITPTYVANLKAMMNAHDPRFKLFAWFGTFTNGSDASGHANARVDLLNAPMRAAAIAAMMTVVGYGFDGVMDDTEDTQEITSIGQMGNGTVLWNNEFAAACHAVGKLYGAYIPMNWFTFTTTHVPNITGPDFLVGVAVDAGDGGWNDRTNQFFTAATGTRVIFNATGQGPAVLDAQLDKLEALPISGVDAEIVGYALYLYPQIATDGPWSRWDTFRAAYP